MASTEAEKRRLDLISRLKPCEKNEKRFTCISAKEKNISEFLFKTHLAGHFKKKPGIQPCAGINMSKATYSTALTRFFPQKLNHNPAGAVCNTTALSHVIRKDMSPYKYKIGVQFLQPLKEWVVSSTESDAVAELGIANNTWHAETEVVIEAEESQKEVLHRAAAAGFAEMCQELTAMVSSDPSFTTPAEAAVKAFKKIKDNPSKIIAALFMFGRHTDEDLASIRSRAIHRAARHAGPAVTRRRVWRPKVMTGPYHVHTQSAKMVPTTAPHYLAIME